ncbi:cyclic nucleotide-binding domain-containing protein [Actinotalea sp. Marseille-Q4924]|uniref:cyclic nucleotide-binding domain-containing protein n=1 Tax=Actinotalea sp. Marseille-Q4924 TaxID=2866571 RepID=UPI001CE493B4|nr:cyclic nucleotide-binding domain-containing protein [Actinotalea sp. Marseille-Q4924]
MSWIPSELVTGVLRVPFDLGLTHYDDPPPDRIAPGDLATLRRAGRFRFVNRVEASARVEDGRVVGVDLGEDCGGTIGLTNLLGGAVRFPAVAMPDLRTVEVADDGARAVVRQTAGGRAPLPAPRLVNGRPRLVAPLVWTTLELELRADGTSAASVTGASAFPRHWVYDDEGALVEKVATTGFDAWLHTMEATATPWRGQDASAVVTPVETELERRLSRQVMGELKAQRRVRSLEAGEELFRQGDAGSDVALLLDGVVEVVRDGRFLVEIGPGAVLGERALLEGARTATVRAVTPLTVALVDGSTLAREDLEVLVTGHRREDEAPEGR